MKFSRLWMGKALCAFASWVAPAYGLDLDSDGVSDVYLDHFGIAPIGIETDLDDDGYTTGAEAQFGTDPGSPASHPDLSPTLAGNQLDLRWSTVAGIVYQLQSSDDLTTWTDDGVFVLGDDNAASATRTPETLRRFYRLSASHGPDEDGDGLDLYEELLLGTDPTNPDTDGDGVSDGEEVQAKTSPTNPDSDGDGISDGEEAARNTDPNDDGDGFTANPEFYNRTTRLAFLGTWPNYPSTPPAMPAIRLSFIDQDTDLEVAYINQAGALTAGASPRGQYSGYSNRAQPDPILEPGKDYTLQLTFAGNTQWGDVFGRFFSTNLNPSGPPLHAVVYSTRTNGGSYYYSNPTGGVWHSTTWQATGAPSNNVANSINFPVSARTAATATVNLPEVDLDVDSDNNDGTGAPGRSRDSDALEDTQAKMVQINDDSDNDDTIPDNTQSQVANEDDLVPLILQVGTKRIDWTKVSLKFSFPQSEVRLWRIAKPDDTKAAALEIQPDTEYPASALGLDRKNRQLKCFMEGMAVSTEDRPITATFLFEGKDFGAKDSVLVRVVKHRLVPAASVQPTDGGLLPSRRGVRGAFHFVSPKAAGGFLTFEALTGEPWSSGTYKLEVTNSDSDTQITGNTVRLSRKEPKKYVIQLKKAADNSLLAEQYVWIIWATPQPVEEDDEVPSKTDTRGGTIFVAAKAKERTFPFMIGPQELFAGGFRTAETPDLISINRLDPIGLKTGVKARLDVSQRVAIKHRNPAPTTIAGAQLLTPSHVGNLATVLATFPKADVLLFDFPSDPLEGNDDHGVGDEDNDPYDTGRVLFRYRGPVGVVGSGDRPSGPAVAKLAGQAGETLSESVKFETFVRLNTGLVPSKSAWLRISDPLEWMVVQRYIRKTRQMEDNGSTYQLGHTGF
jgi:hypothetical protein